MSVHSALQRPSAGGVGSTATTATSPSLTALAPKAAVPADFVELPALSASAVYGGSRGGYRGRNVFALPLPSFTQAARTDLGRLTTCLARLEVLKTYVEAHERKLRRIASRPQQAVYYPEEMKRMRALWGAYYAAVHELNLVRQRYAPELIKLDGARDDKDRKTKEALAFMLVAGAEGALAAHCLKLHAVLGKSEYLQKALDERGWVDVDDNGSWDVTVAHEAFYRLRLEVSSNSRRRELERMHTLGGRAIARLDALARTGTQDVNMRALLHHHSAGHTRRYLPGLKTALNDTDGITWLRNIGTRLSMVQYKARAGFTRVITPVATWLGDHESYRAAANVTYAVITFFFNLWTFCKNLVTATKTPYQPYRMRQPKNERPARTVIAKEPNPSDAKHPRLIRREHAEAALERMQPGDILFSRQNWFYSNLALPGFWKHGLVYVGRPEDIRQAFDADADVQAMVKKKSRGHHSTLTGYLQSTFPEKWAKLAGKDSSGDPNRFVEAISQGVEFTGVQHAMMVDYLAVVRPRVSKADKALAIIRLFEMEGLPYDFGFDFATEKAIVCTESVARAYAPTDGMRQGVRFRPQLVAGRGTLPGNVALPQALESSELVVFLDGRRKTKSVVEGDMKSLLESTRRGNWTSPLP